ncbi:MAG TPA: 16S rRNA (adenine(1518)-N(6)/adenine(1519)-N(6))-dimethyltransferase RsmA [Candidatus Baltobacteraceae bacterium]|nr:16S rRNA (adenine(1518)-N(6)/adenine(1519)-N(6))-dimethyltransferase RsmA [Candidatus Baltobacteraceae bacterium]
MYDHPKALLEQFGYRPKKRLGQNFLMDAGAASRIARLVVEGSSDDEPFRVLEIGPGTGALTSALLQLHANVTAIDVDPDMVRILRSRDELAGAHIVHADALTFDYAQFARGAHWRVTGNLPYNIATPLVMQFIEMENGPQTLVVMVQKEVADRFAAKPATAAYGSLSVAVQYAMNVEKALTLKPGAFYPRPKIDSTVVRLTRRPAPAVEVADEHRFLQVVRAAFAYRRKTLANSVSLSLGVPRAAVAQALAQAGLDTEIRGEQLGLGDFAKLAGHLPA